MSDSSSGTILEEPSAFFFSAMFEGEPCAGSK